jgi:hypothetical protein
MHMQMRTSRTREIAEVSLREMIARLNVIDATIDSVAMGSDMDRTVAANDLLNQFDILAFTASRLRVSDVQRVTDALEAVVLAAQARRHRRDIEVGATLRHGVDVLMLLTHDATRRLQGHPAADLDGATEALFDRVERVLSSGASINPAA